jgi:hypothetical protein
LGYLVTMRGIGIAVLLCVLCSCPAQAQEALPPAISASYDAELSVLQSAKSRADIHKMMEATDTADWVDVAPTGERMSRDVVEQQLSAIVSVPPAERPIPKHKIIYVGDLSSTVLVVYWTYRATARGLVGSMVRDTWIETSEGWRRSTTEKLFPDRILALP